MRLWIINVMLFSALSVMGQTDAANVGGDTIVSRHERELMEKIEKYERRLERYQGFFQSVTPDFLRVQYAGSTGLLNVGCGWDYGKRRQFETDVMLGYVPKYVKESSFFTFTIRQTFVPWTKPLYSDVATFQPFAFGAFVNSVLDTDYWRRNPDRYPTVNYYWFSSKIRIHLFVGQRYTVNIPEHKRYLSSKVSAVWELSTCDLYAVSKAVNKSLSVSDILSLSFGLKYDF